MRDPFDRAVGWLLAAGVLACAGVALAIRPAPLPASAGDRWIALSAQAQRERRLRTTWRIETVDAGDRHLEDAGQVPALHAGERLALGGFAFDRVGRRTAARLAYRVDGGPWHDASYHMPRPDVPVALDAPGAGDSGFAAEIPTGGLAPGPHAVEFGIGAGRALRTLSPPLRFDVEPR